MLKLRKLIKEHTWDREFGDPLVTFEDVMEKHQKNKFKEDLEGKINAELKNSQIAARNLKQAQETIEGNTSLAEIQKTTSIIEPIFIQGLKEIIHEITHGKIKLK